MNKEIIEKAKELSKEERLELLKETKADLSTDDLENVNGGVEPGNPNSEVVDGHSNLNSSIGYVCRGEVCC